jgi:diphthamide synthase subunit DPH2
LLDVDASTPSKSTKISISAFSRSCYHKKEEVTIIFFFQYSAADIEDYKKSHSQNFEDSKSQWYSQWEKSLYERGLRLKKTMPKKKHEYCVTMNRYI